MKNHYERFVTADHFQWNTEFCCCTIVFNELLICLTWCFEYLRYQTAICKNSSAKIGLKNLWCFHQRLLYQLSIHSLPEKWINTFLINIPLRCNCLKNRTLITQMLRNAFIRGAGDSWSKCVRRSFFPFPKKNKQTNKQTKNHLIPTVMKLCESESGSCNLMTVPACVCGDSIYLLTWHISYS